MQSMYHCDERSIFIHEEGHEIPGTRAKASAVGATRAIRRSILRALQP